MRTWRTTRPNKHASTHNHAAIEPSLIPWIYTLAEERALAVRDVEPRAEAVIGVPHVAWNRIRCAEPSPLIEIDPGVLTEIDPSQG